MILNIFSKKFRNLIYKILLLHVFVKSRKKKIIFEESNFLIITVAFNNKEVLEVQHKYLKDNLLDNFDYLIADNSSNPDIRKKIEQFCKENNISYILLPKNPLTKFRASGSHGIALNWCYRNLIKKYKPKYFGFLDHDLFPLVKTNIIPEIRDGFYGVVRKREDKFWYMWPGFSFFEFDKCKKYKFNFFPYHTGIDNIFLDTGGSNYKTIFSKIDKNTFHYAKSILVDLNTKQKLAAGNDTSRTFEIIENAWLHMRQISWREESRNKMSDQAEMIELSKNIISAD